MNSWLAQVLLAAGTVIFFQSLSEGRYFRRLVVPSNSLASIDDSPPSLYDSPHFSPVFPLAKTSRTKRMLFDSSCKGIYDGEMITKLDSVCDACYNLYRKPYIATECRKYCFNNGVFDSCLFDLMMHDVADEYREMVQYVG